MNTTFSPSNPEPRSIIHLNVADFAVAVERVVNLRLRERPVIVAADGATRAAVFDMSEEAYQAGVKKGMLLKRACKLCPQARIVPPHFDHYERAMTAFLKQAFPYSPLVEAVDGNGHVFADVTGTGRLFGPAEDVAWRIRKNARQDLNLDPIWSVAPNKLMAKVATRLVKPTGEYIIQAGEEEDLLSPLPVHILPGLEREDLLRLREFNISRVGQAARWSEAQLEVVFGKRGSYLHRAVRGVDHSPVLPAGQSPPSIRAGHEFGEDSNDVSRVEGVLYSLVEKAGFELRERGRVARRVAVVLDYNDGVRLVRQKSAGSGTNSDFKLFPLARTALTLAWQRRQRLRHLTLILDRLAYPSGQLELFALEENDSGFTENLMLAFDRIRKKFGARAINLGRSLAAA